MSNDINQKKKIMNDLLYLINKEQLTFEEKKNIISNYHLHFHYSRYNNVQWKREIDNFFLNSKKDLSHFKKLFDFDCKLQDRHYHSLKYITEKQSMPSLFFNIHQDVNGFEFLKSYKSHFMFKHFQSCVFHLSRFLNFKHKNEDLIKSANRHSITGKIFNDTDNEVSFTIPLNKASTFLFLDKGKILGLDVSIDHVVDYSNLVPHFLITHASYSDNIEDLKRDFVLNSKKEHDELIMEYCDGRNIDINKITNLLKLNCNYVMCFENGFGNSLISRENLSTIKTIGLEKHSLYDLFFGNRFYSLLFNQLFYSSKIETQTITERDYSISYIMNSIIENNFETLINSFDFYDQDYIRSAALERFIFILRGLNEDNSDFNSFKKSCLRSGIEKESLVEKLYNKIILEKEFNSMPSFLIQNKFVKEIRDTLLRNLLETIIEKEKSKGSTPEEIIEKIIPYSSIRKTRKTKSMLKKI